MVRRESSPTRPCRLFESEKQSVGLPVRAKWSISHGASRSGPNAHTSGATLGIITRVAAVRTSAGTACVYRGQSGTSAGHIAAGACAGAAHLFRTHDSRYTAEGERPYNQRSMAAVGDRLSSHRDFLAIRIRAQIHRAYLERLISACGRRSRRAVEQSVHANVHAQRRK